MLSFVYAYEMLEQISRHKLIDQRMKVMHIGGHKTELLTVRETSNSQTYFLLTEGSGPF